MARQSQQWSWSRQLALWNAALTLAIWRWRTQWFLLLCTGIGITIAVALVSSLPLFANVMTTAGLRSVLRAQGNSAQIVATTSLQGLSTNELAAASAQVNRLVKKDGGQYLTGEVQTKIITGNWYLHYGGFTLDFYGVPSQSAPAHIHILQGSLPAENSPSSSEIDIMLTKTAAANLGDIQVGDTLPIDSLLLTGPDATYGLPQGASAYVTAITVHVVGIFQTKANDAYWDGTNLEAPPLLSRQTPPPYLALVSQSALLTMLDTIAQQHHAPGVFFADQTENTSLLSYMLNTSHITSSQINDLISHLGTLQQNVYQTFAPNSVPSGTSLNITAVDLSGPVLHDPETESIVEKYRDQEAITQTPVLVLTTEITALILFFISVMTSTLVERDQLSIAVLRSRGASRRQVFSSLLTQGLILCIVAGLIGPLLAIGLVYGSTPHFLTATTQDALNAPLLHPWQSLHEISIYTLVAVAATFLTLFFSLYQATRATILTQRRELSRSTRLPLWQHLRLDLIIALLAIAGYLLVLYLEDAQQLLTAQSQSLVSTPLALLAPLLLVLAGILGFLRLFPLFLHLLTRLAQRRRGLTALLALAHMERSPSQPMRMALLLGLATAFVFFSLTFSASQGQRARDIATYQAVSDFSGSNIALPGTTVENMTSVLSQTTDRYLHIRGVTSASVGFMDTLYVHIDSGTQQAYTRKTELSAVDANTFAQTAIWTNQDSQQSLSSLMALLVAQRPQAMQQGVVPAIVAVSTWQLMGLTPGMAFHLTNDYGGSDSTTYVAVAEVSHIPPVDDTLQGALLVDYQSLVAGRARYQESTQPDYIWLRTSNNPTLVSDVRASLEDPNLALVDLLDLRTLTGDNATDPLASNLLSVMGVGVAAALLLALLANLLLPLLSVYARQTNFAVLRALGTDPRQVRHILTWELALVLTTALLLGLLFGALLALTAVPPLIFTGVLPTNLTDISSAAIYALQQIVPIRIITPPSLLLALLALLLLSLCVLALMTRLAQSPLLGQALLVDED